MIEDIRSLNARNYMVIIPGAVGHHGKKFEDYDDMNSEFGLGVDEILELQYHGLILPFLSI